MNQINKVLANTVYGKFGGFKPGELTCQVSSGKTLFKEGENMIISLHEGKRLISRIYISNFKDGSEMFKSLIDENIEKGYVIKSRTPDKVVLVRNNMIKRLFSEELTIEASRYIKPKC